MEGYSCYRMARVIGKVKPLPANITEPRDKSIFYFLLCIVFAIFNYVYFHLYKRKIKQYIAGSGIRVADVVFHRLIIPGGPGHAGCFYKEIFSLSKELQGNRKGKRHFASVCGSPDKEPDASIVVSFQYSYNIRRNFLKR